MQSWISKLLQVALMRACTVTAASFYFSTSADANDKNSGKTPDSPWRSLSKASSIPRAASTSVFLERVRCNFYFPFLAHPSPSTLSYAPHALVLFLSEKGSLWVNERLQIDLMTNGTLTAYGDTSLPRPG